jgi:hypothetical protein
VCEIASKGGLEAGLEQAGCNAVADCVKNELYTYCIENRDELKQKLNHGSKKLGLKNLEIGDKHTCEKYGKIHVES